ncbi:hypothetical protein FGG44_gp84 [Mycobacterium phage MacnCheese]|uniref:Uncharacterized protein n=1 Tax=Mycobacterium phage MacnCheese TaxID=2927982 RepID=I6X3E7_9CAUD|nr:hypothetical protein FGG44_gp84 [Mycobacterium phage MacnCheese]AFN37772.1 hypothetical protein MACNCHEESE_84 [Mycobacterium phage MacnCheese]
MSVADQFPARVGTDGRAWFRPARPAGVDMAQWGWTSQPALAHADYGRGPHVVVHTPSATAVLCGGPGACTACDEDAQCNGLHREGTCGGECSGCVGDGEGGPTRSEAVRLRQVALDEARTAIEAAGLLW